MPRWDEIRSLPVQNPSTMEFASCDLVWSKIEGPCGNLDRLALIPFHRVDDFVRGESSNKDCPTRFHVEARRKHSTKMRYKPKADGILEYILFTERKEWWCHRLAPSLGARKAHGAPLHGSRQGFSRHG
ncbi:hypothetical protein Tco_0960203 [Tanacetum coccineum]